MTKQVFWEMFRETGDPTCYMLYRATEAKNTRADYSDEIIANVKNKLKQTGGH